MQTRRLQQMVGRGGVSSEDRRRLVLVAGILNLLVAVTGLASGWNRSALVTGAVAVVALLVYALTGKGRP